MALLPSPTALVELTRYAVGQVMETAASVATVPVRVLGLLGQTELLVSRVTMLAERAEGLISRVDGVVGGIEETLRETKVIMAAAALAVDEAGAVALRAALVVDGAAVAVTKTTGIVDDAAVAVTKTTGIMDDAARITGAADGVVRQASALSAEAQSLLDGYASTLRRAAPLAARFVEELTPEEVTAAIRMIDELPRLRQHLSEDVMPLLGKLDQVGPDLHALLEVTNDLHLAIAGLPGLKMLRRRGEAREAEEDATNGR